MKQLHTAFETKEVIEIFERYLSGILDQKQAQALLKIGRSRFFDLLKSYREKPDDFSIEYRRTKATRKISAQAEKKIVAALEQDKKLIQDRHNPIRHYNYSFIRETLERKHDIKVSLTTIINRAKKMNFTSSQKTRFRTIMK